MALRKIPYARLDGSTPRARRTLDIKMACCTLYIHQIHAVDNYKCLTVPERFIS